MLSLKQQRFVDYYIESGNASQSYAKAGYIAKTKNTRDVSAHKLLRNPKLLPEIDRRRKEVYEAGLIRIESKRTLLWEIACKASGKIKPCGEDPFIPDYKAAIAAINELNRMDGHHSSKKVQITDDRFTFDAEILPPESEDAEFIQLDEPEQNDI